MHTLFTDLVGLILAAGIGTSPAPRAEVDVDWSCQSPQWTSGPAVEGGQFKGTIEVDCEFGAVANVGFPALKQYFIEEAKSTAKEIHAGPNDETFEGMPSSYLDVTSNIEIQGNTATVRADVHLATDTTSRFLFSTASKKITGTGQAKYLRAVTSEADVRSTATAGRFTVQSKTSMVVDKPGIVPAEFFKKKIVEGIEEELPNQEKELIEKVANHL